MVLKWPDRGAGLAIWSAAVALATCATCRESPNSLLRTKDAVEPPNNAGLRILAACLAFVTGCWVEIALRPSSLRHLRESRRRGLAPCSQGWILMNGLRPAAYPRRHGSRLWRSSHRDRVTRQPSQACATRMSAADTKEAPAPIRPLLGRDFGTASYGRSRPAIARPKEARLPPIR